MIWLLVTLYILGGALGAGYAADSAMRSGDGPVAAVLAGAFYALFWWVLGAISLIGFVVGFVRSAARFAWRRVR